MSKLTTLLSAVFAGLSMTAAAQTFTAPVYSEDIVVPGTSMLVSRSQHTSCYSMANINFGGTPNNLYTYTWCSSSSGGTLNGIGWSRRDAGDNVINDGYIPLNGTYRDLEAGFVKVDTSIYVIATYYKAGLGHAYDIYRWNSGGLTALTTGNVLSSSATPYGRISIDFYLLYGVAITWQDTQGVKVKVALASGSGLTVGNTIQVSNATNGVIPDVALCRTNVFNVRIAYVNNGNGTINVMHEDFYTLLAASGSMAFVVDDVNPVGFPSVSSADITGAPNSLNIDSPDDYGYDNWSYAYTTDNMTVRGRTKSVNYSSTPFNFVLSAGLTGSNVAPVVSYDVSGRQINYGWCTTYSNKGYVAVTKRENGSTITPPGVFDQVSTTPPGTGAMMSFSKQGNNSSQMYVVYPCLPPGGSFDIRTKLAPWGTPTVFRPGATGAQDMMAAVNNITVYPNPFSNIISLKASADKGSELYALNITDIGGRIVLQMNGTLATLNGGLAQWSPQAGAGIYLMHVTAVKEGNTQVLKIVKKN